MVQFASDTAVSQKNKSTWEAEVHHGWRIGSAANGGYALSLVGRTLAAALNQPDPLSINAFYLAPVGLGRVEISVESLSETRSTHFASADLRRGVNSQVHRRGVALACAEQVCVAST